MSTTIQFPTADEVAAALAAEPVDDLVHLSDEERKVAAHLLPKLAAKANEQAETIKAKELARVVDELRASNNQMIEAELEKMRSANKPPSAEELAMLLNQEYQTFKVVVPLREGKEREFTIREMPQAVEMEFVRAVQKTLVPNLKVLSSTEWTAGMSTAERLQKVVDLVPDALTLMAEICALCLDPYKEDGITVEWVTRNMSSYRIMSVIEAQIMAGRMRDFFLRISRAIPG